MIRERREQDLEPLCSILKNMNYPAALSSGVEFKNWLTERDAQLSWVFDMAPVSVAPTKNVAGHVQIYRPATDSSTPYLAEYTNRPSAIYCSSVTLRQTRDL